MKKKPAELHRNPPPRLRAALIIAAYLFAFIILDMITKQFERLPGIVAWYPPAGLTYTLLLIFGIGFAPAVTIALFISSVFIHRMPQPPYLLFLWAVIISLIYSLAAAFLRRRIRFDWQLRKLRDVAWLVFTAMFVSALLAILSVVSSALSSDMPRSDVLYAIFEWWIGETVGVLTITPFLLIFVMPSLKRFAEGQPLRSPARRSFPHPTPSVIGQTASLALILYLVFGAPLLSEFHPLFLVILPIIWIALDHGLKGVGAGLVALNFGVVLALWFFRFDPAQMGELELLMIVTCIAGLLMGAVVTERKGAEESLRESEERYRTLIEQASDGIFLADSAGRYIEVNSAACRLLGYTREEILQKTIRDLTKTAPAQPLRLDELRQGKAILSEQEMIRKDGTLVQVEISAKQLPDGRLQGITRDITERKQSEEGIVAAEKLARESLMTANQSRLALLSVVEDQKRTEENLAAAEAELRSLFAAMTDVVIVYDAEGRYLKIAPTKLTSLYRSLDEMLGKTVYDILPKEQADYIVARIRESIQSGETVNGEYALQMDGQARWFSANVSRLSESTAVWVAHDITERKQAEEELRESKALFETVVENVPLMIFLKEATDLRFVIFNRAGEELLGYDRQALLGKNNLDLFPPEQAAHFMAKDREVLNGEAGMLDIPEEPIQTAMKGQRLLHTRKVCIRGADGITKYLLGISEDITERLQAEDEIKKQLDELQRWHNATLGREMRVLEIKREVNELLGQAGQPPRYPSAET